ncbi:MAG: hypothetical protein RL508_924 [Actinomycetota bacterium]|jgi:energy-coupling factor transporter ATP-binding protein EcfA2
MQWFWILPSLGYGVYLFATTGNYSGLIFGGMSLLSMGGSQWMQRRRREVDTKQEVYFGNNRVAIGNRVLPKSEWLWKPEWTDRVYGSIVEEVAQRNSRVTIEGKVAGKLSAESFNPDGLTAWLGFASSVAIELDLTAEGYHGLVIGPTGSGKSQLLATWLVSLCSQYDARRLNLALIDFKGGACLGAFAGQPQTKAFATDLDGNVASVFDGVAAELARRSQLLAGAGLPRVQDLPTHARPPYLLVVVDEAQPVLALPQVAAVVDNIASRGRSLGVHIVLTGQSLSGIPRSIIGNLGTRFLLGKADPVEMAQLGMARSEPVLQQSTAEWAPATMVTPVRQLRFNFASSGKVQAAKLKEYAPPANPFIPQAPPKFSQETGVWPAHIIDLGEST